ncbi:DUF2933 domain-containing protein [Arcobacter sp. KX21116]|uniref:DUF2933 domain-containing protein n=1 Tax=Arcobacter iocasae TaxID=2906515 RepID=UPI0035D47C00
MKKNKILIILIVSVVVYFFLQPPKVLFDLWPLLLLLCPIIHLFMHNEHNHN